MKAFNAVLLNLLEALHCFALGFNFRTEVSCTRGIEVVHEFLKVICRLIHTIQVDVVTFAKQVPPTTLSLRDRELISARCDSPSATFAQSARSEPETYSIT